MVAWSELCPSPLGASKPAAEGSISGIPARRICLKQLLPPALAGRRSARVAYFQQQQVEEMCARAGATALAYMQARLLCLCPRLPRVSALLLQTHVYRLLPAHGCDRCRRKCACLPTNSACAPLLPATCLLHPRNVRGQHPMCQTGPAAGSSPAVQERWPAVREQELRNHLGSFGIKGGIATQPLSTLSGGAPKGRRGVGVGMGGGGGGGVGDRVEVKEREGTSQHRTAQPCAESARAD